MSILAKVSVFILMLNTLFYSNSKGQNGYEIVGSISDLSENEKLLLVLIEEPFKTVAFDSAIVRNGQFHFKGVISEGPRLFYLSFEKHKYFLVLVVNNGERLIIKSKYKFSAIPTGVNIRRYVTIDGNPSGDDLFSLEGLMSVAIQGTELTKAELRKKVDSIGYDRQIFEGIIGTRDLYNGIIAQYLKTVASTNSVIPLFLIDVYNYIGHESFVPLVYEKLTKQSKESYYGKILSKRLNLCVGQNAPDFSISNNIGKSIDANEIFTQNKLTLIHFWNFKSYDADFENYKEKCFKELNDKGFNLVSVSLDKSTLQTVSWYQVSNQKNEDELAIKAYNIDYPTCILVDQKGKILAWDIDKSLLQFYLDKTFGSVD